jgi:hypothetical protein
MDPVKSRDTWRAASPTTLRSSALPPVMPTGFIRIFSKPLADQSFHRGLERPQANGGEVR